VAGAKMKTRSLSKTRGATAEGAGLFVLSEYEVAPISIVRFLSALPKACGLLSITRLAITPPHCGRSQKKSKNAPPKKQKEKLLFLRPATASGPRKGRFTGRR